MTLVQLPMSLFFFFNDTATTEIYTLSLHDALPIFDAGGAERDGGELVLEGPEVEVALAVREVEEREAEPLPEGRPLAEGADQVLIERADRPAWHAVLGGVAEDDVLVTVVVRRADAHLRPFPAEVGDEVRAPRVTGHRVALPDGLLRLAPVLRRDRLGVVGDAPEVQAGAEAREVARVGGRVSALALEHRQAPDESVGREGGVDVEVTEEDLLPRCLCRGHGSGRDGRGGNRRPGRCTGLLVTPATAGDEHRHDDDSWPAAHGSPPSRMCRVVLQQGTAPAEQKSPLRAHVWRGGDYGPPCPDSSSDGARPAVALGPSVRPHL